MNATGDDHVSFTAMYIECSPSGNHLLVQTDKDRIIVMRTHTNIQVSLSIIELLINSLLISIISSLKIFMELLIMN